MLRRLYARMGGIVKAVMIENMGYSTSLDSSRDEGPDRWAFTYRVTGDIRFISHKDMMRLFQRALARASLPVRYSEGFNPHAKLSITLPRPVGVSSDEEVLVIQFSDPIDGEAAKSDLARQMPAGIELIEANHLERGERWMPVRVEYRMTVPDDTQKDLPGKVQRIVDSEELLVERTLHKNGHTRRFDARPYITNVTLNDHEVYFTLLVTREGTLRPVEFARLLGFDETLVSHRIHRVRIEWRKEKKRANQTHDTTTDSGTSKQKESCSQET